MSAAPNDRAGPLRPNSRSHRVQESLTLAIAAKAMALKAEGRDVVSLSAGEPDFPTPDEVAAAGIEAVQQGRYRYTPAAGKPVLRAAGARWLNGAFGFDYGPAEVIATAGAKAALHMALDTVVEKGDAVIILCPYWVSYPALVTMADGIPWLLEPAPQHGFVHTAAQLEDAVGRSRARGIIMNFPNNPSGAVPTRAQMQALVDVATRHGLWILSDEIYGQMIYDGLPHVSPANVAGGRERTLIVNGFTKSHTLTGWRISFLAGPQHVIEAAARIQSQVLGNPCTISQEAALAACNIDLRAEQARRVGEFDRRRRFLVDEINRIPGLSLRAPQGTFYALVDVGAVCAQRGQDDVQFAEQLLAEQLLAGVPGSAFGVPGYLRLSFAAGMDELKKGVQRLRAHVVGRT